MYRKRNELYVQEKVANKLAAKLKFAVIDKDTGRALAFYASKRKAYEHRNRPPKHTKRVILTNKLNLYHSGDLIWQRQKHKQ